MSQTTFNSMPNECIQLILAKFPLNSLLPLRAVCHRWQDQITALCELRSELKLFATRANFAEYSQDLHTLNLAENPEFRILSDDDSVLYVSVVGEEFWNFLLRLFPRITKAIFYLETVWSLEQVWTLLNSCTQLRRLHLFDLYEVALPEQFPLLGQLEHLSVFRHKNQIAQTLSQLGPNCSSLSLGLCTFPLDSLQQVLRSNPPIFQSLTCLCLSHILWKHGAPSCPEHCTNVVNFFAENCPILNSIDVTNLDPEIVLHQAQLQNVTTLQARFGQIFNYFAQYLQLSNVRILTVTDPTTYLNVQKHFFYQNRLPEIFTSLEELRLVLHDEQVFDDFRQIIGPGIQFRDRSKVKISYRLEEN